MELVVTKVEQLRGGKSRVWINDEPAFRLPREECEKRNLAEGLEVTADMLAQVHTDVLLPLAKRKCLDYLVAADRTEKMVLDRLRRDEFPEDVASLAVRYAKEFHYIDDRRYALAFIESRREKKNRKEITAKLLEKGIPQEIIADAFAEAGDVDTVAQIRLLADQRGYDPETADEIQKRRFYQYLARKGYRWQDISGAF